MGIDWHTTFNQPAASELNISPTTRFEKHVKELFRYYGHKVDYANVVICPLIGRLLDRKNFYDENLPDSMDMLLFYQNEMREKFLKKKAPICIQDPFELSHNVGKLIDFNVLERFRQFCVLSERQYNGSC